MDLENIATFNLLETIESKATDPQQLRAIKSVGKIVSEGMSIEDSCLLSRITPETWEKWEKEIPEIGQYIHIQRLEYKRQLIKVLNTQATTNQDFKIALSLLTTAFPSEFNPAIQKENEKKKGLNPDNKNPLVEVFQIIQNSAETPINTKQTNTEDKPDTPSAGKSIRKTLMDIIS